MIVSHRISFCLKSGLLQHRLCNYCIEVLVLRVLHLLQGVLCEQIHTKSSLLTQSAPLPFSFPTYVASP